MATKSIEHRSLRITKTTPVSSCIVTARGTSSLLIAPPSSRPPRAPSTVSRSVPLVWIANSDAATVPCVRNVVTGKEGLEA